jgi:hypothetical protein
MGENEEFMSQLHQITMSSLAYPGGLRIFECKQCRYAFAAEVDATGVLDLNTKVPINQGDLAASHNLFQTPEIQLELEVSAEMERDYQSYFEDF